MQFFKYKYLKYVFKIKIVFCIWNTFRLYFAGCNQNTMDCSIRDLNSCCYWNRTLTLWHSDINMNSLLRCFSSLSSQLSFHQCRLKTVVLCLFTRTEWHCIERASKTVLTKMLINVRTYLEGRFKTYMHFEFEIQIHHCIWNTFERLYFVFEILLRWVFCIQILLKSILHSTVIVIIH